MHTFKQYLLLLEKAPTNMVKFVDIFMPFLKSGLDVEEMRNSRGSEFARTESYQIRIKPTTAIALPELLEQAEKFLKAKGKQLGIGNVVVNRSSPHSSKYSSIEFTVGESKYDLVFALGGNAGESFEKELLGAMQDFVAGEFNELADAAFNALDEADDELALTNIVEVKARTGKTNRSGDTPPDEVGKIIADIIIVTNDGEEHYISVKNKKGQSVGQFGMSAAFKKDLKVDTSTKEWESYAAPFDLDVNRIEHGLEAYVDGVDIGPNTDTDTVSIPKKSKVYDVLRSLWGSGYIYLRHTGDSFKAFKVDKDYVDNQLLKNLKVTEIRYPNMDRKQITIFISSDSTKYKLEMRNPRGGPTEIAPTQAQLVVISSTSELNK